MLTGSTFTGVETDGIVDLGGISPLQDVTIGKGTYLNAPTEFRNVILDTSEDSITFDSVSGLVAGGEIFFDVSQIGTREIFWNVDVDFTIRTPLPASRFTNNGTGVMTIEPIVGYFQLSGIPLGSRVSMIKNGLVAETFLTTDTLPLVTSTSYEINDVAAWNIFTEGFQQLNQTYTVTTDGQIDVTVNMMPSDGFNTQTSITIADVDGTVLNAGGDVSVDTTALTFTINNPNLDIRDTFSGIAKGWLAAELGGSLGYRMPLNLDSVKGLELLDTWSIVNRQNVINEGWVELDTLDSELFVGYRFVATGNTHDIKYALVYDEDSESIVTLSGPQNTAIPLDVEAGNIRFRTQIKWPNIVFINKEETIRIDSDRNYQKDYKNVDTNYTETEDANITRVLGDSEGNYRYVDGAVVKGPDDVGVTHTFLEGVLEVTTGITSTQQLMNELAAISSYNDSFETKPFTFVGNVVHIDSDYWVQQRDGTSLLPSLQALTKVYSAQGEYKFTEARSVIVDFGGPLDSDIDLVIFDSDGASTFTDVDGVQTVYTIPAGTSIVSKLIFSNVDVPCVIAVNAPGWAAESQDAVFLPIANTYRFFPARLAVNIPDSDQAADDATAGLLKWKDVIDLTTFDGPNRKIIVPTELDGGDVVKSYNVAYFYFAWKKWVDEDPDNLKYNIACFVEEQLKPSGATDNSYKLKPGFFMQNSWVLDVEPTRSVTDIVRIEASTIARIDDYRNSGLVYASPLANGANSMAEVIITGASTQAIQDTYTQTLAIQSTVDQVKILSDQVRSLTGWMSGNGKLFGLKPLREAWNPDSDYLK